MRPRQAAWLRPWVALALCLGTLCAQGASFDCARARTKLNRMICADAELSALDSRVWDAYGARIAGASVAQYMHLRERHFAWRRQRGWYDATIDALKDDYQRHLAWLTHPLLALEGRYEHDDDLSVQVEIDADAAAQVSILGSARAPGLVRHAFAWTSPASGEPANHLLASGAAGEARPTVALTDRGAAFAPAFIGAPPAPVQDCRIDIRFGDDELVLETLGACGAPLSGRYRKRVTPTSWGIQ